MQIPDQSLIVAIVTTGFGTVLTLGAQQWFMHRANIKRLREHDERLTFVLSEHLPHSHTETHGKQLTQSGIRYPVVKFNGGNGR